MQLIKPGVDFQAHESSDSASAFAQAALRAVGAGLEDAVQVAAHLRRRDQGRLELQLSGGICAGVELMHSNRVKPELLTPPTRTSQPLNDLTAAAKLGQP